MASNKSAQEHFNEAAQFLRQGKLQEASECLRAGLRLDPTHQQAWMNLGVALKDLGDYGEAERCLLQATKLDQNDGNSWFNLGSLYLRELNRHEDAYQNLKKAIRCNPNDEDAVSFSAEALVKLQRPEEAIKLLDKALSEHPNWKSASDFRNLVSHVLGIE